MEKEEILNVIENLKIKIEEIENLSKERDLNREDLHQLATLFEALYRMEMELPGPRLTVQLGVNPNNL